MKLAALPLIALGLAAGPAFASLSAQNVKAFGGLYSVKCGTSGVPQLTVAADAVTMQNGNKRLVARKLTVISDYFGRGAPETFEGAIVGDLKPKAHLTFLVYNDRAGQYITVEEDRKKVKYRRCK
jgi:hypothetical protein